MKIFSPTVFIQHLILKKYIGKVLSGPFEGLYLKNEHVAAAGFPTMLGTYEKELLPYFSASFLEKYSLFIDVGAGEGYFLNGVIKNNPKIKCIAFERNEEGQRLIKTNLELNNFSKAVNLLGEANIETLNKSLVDSVNKNTLILIDVEGFEAELLDPIRCDQLLHADIIVEVHECFRPGLENLIKSRFESSHHIEIVSAKKRTLNDFPLRFPLLTKFIFKKYIIHLMGEGRPKTMNWFVMIKK